MRSSTPKLLSVVVPVYNEALNIQILCDEIINAIQGKIADYEIIFINDGSTDQTEQLLSKLMDEHPFSIRYITHGKNSGQSAAVITGIQHASGTWIATLDGDGQNDPRDIPKLMSIAIENTAYDNILIAGYRIKRRDNFSKRLSTKIANGVRKKILNDDCPDTGCGLKIFQRNFFLTLPQFNHMHRFLPALVKRANGKTINVPVNHRPRLKGTSKYGVWNRLWVGIVDLIGVSWLIRRSIKIIPITVGASTIAKTEKIT